MLLRDIAAIVFAEITSQKIALKKHSNVGININGALFVPKTFNAMDFFTCVPGLKNKLDSDSALRLQVGSAEFIALLRLKIDEQSAKDLQSAEASVGDLRIDFGFKEEHSRLDDIEIYATSSPSTIHVYSKTAEKFQKFPRYEFNDVIENVPKEVKSIVKSKIQRASAAYHPALPQGCFEVTEYHEDHYNLFTAKAINLYLQPKWVVYEGRVSPRLDPTIKKLFCFLFVGEGCVKYVFRWIRTLLFDFEIRLPIMVLYSGGGTGKGLLFDILLKGLVRADNHGKPSSKQFGRFDDHFSTKHLMYSSEAELDARGFNRLKDLYDQHSTFEKKGVDIGGSKRIATKFVLSSNNSASLYMTYDARKFTVPDLVRGPMFKDYATTEERSYLASLENNHEKLAEFAYWLRDTFEPLDNEEVWHGADFKTLCEVHLPEWFKVFRGMLQRRKEFTYEEFCDAQKSRVKTGISTVEKVADQYGVATGQKICDIVPSVDGVSDGYVYKSLIYVGEGNG